MKKIMAFALALCAALCIYGCAGKDNNGGYDINNYPEPGTAAAGTNTTAQTTQTQDPDTLKTEADGSVLSSEMPDGFRFESSVWLEGMEEKVQYEHAISLNAGISIDYDYGMFTRMTGEASETFVSVYDDGAQPKNYIAISASPADGETMKGIIEAYLKQTFGSILTEQTDVGPFTGCTRFTASNPITDDFSADSVTVQYVIPANDGSRLVELYYTVETAEGFGSRMEQMLDTLQLRNIDWSKR